ncbi:hypothetical protein CAOG_02585 [Capsaspora owczarzaki ATCC 30864]|nr:hypothetical protein CAOG_02585 [Capsaspora owczarzaki ATCC 30864]|eukprot:XP_004349335.1 hypothetical protein CAOG_02585 [Capsaspora owczarzaki ATCC 30864]
MTHVGGVLTTALLSLLLLLSLESLPLVAAAPAGKLLRDSGDGGAVNDPSKMNADDAAQLAIAVSARSSSRQSRRQSSPSLFAGTGLSVPIMPLAPLDPFPDPLLEQSFGTNCNACRAILPTFQLMATLTDVESIRSIFVNACVVAVETIPVQTVPINGSIICPLLSDRYVAPLVNALGLTTLTSEELCEYFDYCVVLNKTQNRLGQFPPPYQPSMVVAGLSDTKQRSERSVRRDDANPRTYSVKRATRAMGLFANALVSSLFGSSTTQVPRTSKKVQPTTEPSTHQHDHPARTSRRHPARTSRKSSAFALPVPSTTPKYAPGETIRLLQITDINLDMAYEPNSNTNCDQLVCCHASNGPGTAGPFGDYNCNTPLRTLRSLFAYINATFSFDGNTHANDSTAPNGRIDYVLWTGNNGPLDIWNSSWNRTLEANRLVRDLFLQTMPNVTVFPAVGSHDVYPDNLFNYNTDQYILDAYADLWSPWFPNKTLLEPVQRFGAYTQPIRPGLRLVATNSYQSNKYNYFVALDRAQPRTTEQIAFFTETFTQALMAQERLVIIGNIAPGSVDVTPTYSSGAIQFIAAFPNSAVLNVYGYVHRDLFSLIHAVTAGNATVEPDLIVDQPVDVVFSGPPVSPNSQVNPSFRVYTLNGTTFELIDHETYTFDLTGANAAAAALSTPATDEQLDDIALRSWAKLYNLKETYNMTDTSVASFANLSQRIRNEPEVANLFSTLAVGASAPVACPLSTCGVEHYCATAFSVINYVFGCVVGLSSTSS